MPPSPDAAHLAGYIRAARRPALACWRATRPTMLKRAGYRLTQKAMNTWIREHFHDDDEVAEVRPQNKHCWKGFKPV